MVLRRTRLDLAGLYRQDGPYWYVNGFNPNALAALLVGMALCVPGVLGGSGGDLVGGKCGRAAEGGAVAARLGGAL